MSIKLNMRDLIEKAEKLTGYPAEVDIEFEDDALYIVITLDTKPYISSNWCISTQCRLENFPKMTQEMLDDQLLVSLVELPELLERERNCEVSKTK